MPFGVIGFGQPGLITQPSGNIWGDCPLGELVDESLGFYVDRPFASESASGLPALPNFTAAGSGFGYDPVLDTVMVSSTVSTGAAANIGFFTRPIGKLALGNGLPIWAETCIEFGSTGTATSTQGFFFGLATGTGVLANAITSTLIQDASTLNGSTSLVGFWLHGGTSNTFDAIYQKGSPATTGSVSTVLADVLNAAANNPDPGNPSYVPPTPPGNLNTSTFVKLGLRWDGQKYMYFYVNGNPVAKAQVDANWNQTSTYAAGQWLYSGTSTNVCFVKTDFFRAAAKVY